MNDLPDFTSDIQIALGPEKHPTRVHTLTF